MLHRSRVLAVFVAVVSFGAGASGCDHKAEGTGPKPTDSGSGSSKSGSPASSAPVAVAVPGAPAAITVDSDGFKPNAVKLKKGAPGTIVFTRTTDETCATEVVFPELEIKKELPKGKPVSITIPTDKEQTLTFQCGMGMYKSSVVVTAN